MDVERCTRIRSTAGSLGGNFTSCELFHDLISAVSLNLDHALLDGTPGAAEAFEITREFAEFLGPAWESRYGGDGLAPSTFAGSGDPRHAVAIGIENRAARIGPAGTSLLRQSA